MCLREELKEPRDGHMLKFMPSENTRMQAFDRELDVRGLNCPLPILRAKKALGDLTAGQVLKVMATDPGSVKDFQAFCKQTGNELLSHSEGAEFTFFMKKR
jgi:tRNA 2-thiouridine synthesizing protein A